MIDYSIKPIDISVIIPYFNNANTIKETLNCLHEQLFSNFEVLIIEDKNSDSIPQDILKDRYSFELHYFKNDDGLGASSNRNLGINKAKGKFIQFLDADDIITKDKLIKQIAILQEKRDSIAICKWGVFKDSINNFTICDSPLYKNLQYIEYLKLLNGVFNVMMPLHSYLIPKAIISKTGYWDETINLGDDGEFMNRVIANCQNIYYSNDGMALYRRGDNKSLSHQTNYSYANSNFRCAVSYEKLIVAKFDNDPSMIQSVIKKYNLFFFWSYIKYPDLAHLAEMRIKSLGGKLNLRIGNVSIKMVQKIIGTKTYLKLRHHLFNK